MPYEGEAPSLRAFPYYLDPIIEQMADKVIQFDRNEVDQYVAMLTDVLDSLSSSSMFEAEAGASKHLP